MHVERQYPRYALEAEAVVHHEGAEVARGRTANVSRGGLCANVAGPLPRGTAVDVELALVFENEQFSEPLVVPARVVWCTQIGGRWQLGMSFLALGPDRARYLELFLRFLSEGQATRAASEPEPASDGDDDPFAR